MGRTGASIGRVVLVATIVLLTVSGCRSVDNGADTVPELEPTPVAEVHTQAPIETTIETETVTEPVSYQQVQQDDPNLDVGVVQVTTAGLTGVRTLTYQVTKKGTREIARELVSDTVTTAPVDEVTSVGTRVAPPAPVPFVDSGAGACDPNYSGPCVPIASDVDCAGGSGNGPAYVEGPVWVVGSDIYDLDRDGDGVACD